MRTTRRRNGRTRRNSALNARPRVVVYVTRENPQTGFDELLVFDLLHEPDFAAVVPGGRVEPGATVAETAVRELAEETGLEVRFVRELGVLEQESWRVPGVRDENHFVHAVPAGPTRDEWVNGGVFRCRWVPLGGDTPVFGEHGALLSSIVRRRVVAYVTRGRQLLVFDHEGTTQVPGGRIDFHESLADGLAREVEEETGLAGVRVVQELAGPDEIVRLYDVGGQPNYALHAVTDAETPDAWEHEVTGTGMDSGFVFRCRWVALDDCPPLWGKPDPLVERLRASIEDV